MNSTPHNNGAGARRSAAGSGDPRPAQGTGRDANGRFAKGNAGGPGNPFARKVAALRKAVVDSVSADDLQAIFLVLLRKAKTGDTAAAKLLFQYALGKPGAAADPDRVDINEWQLKQEQSRPAAEMGKVMNGMPVDMLNRLTNIIWPCTVEAQLTNPLLAGIAEMDRRDAQGAKKRSKGDGLPEAVVERLAMGPLGGMGPSILGMDNDAPWETPSPNERNGRRHRKDKRARNGQRG